MPDKDSINKEETPRIESRGRRHVLYNDIDALTFIDRFPRRRILYQDTDTIMFIDQDFDQINQDDRMPETSDFNNLYPDIKVGIAVEAMGNLIQRIKDMKFMSIQWTPYHQEFPNKPVNKKPRHKTQIRKGYVHGGYNKRF